MPSPTSYKEIVEHLLAMASRADKVLHELYDLRYREIDPGYGAGDPRSIDEDGVQFVYYRSGDRFEYSIPFEWLQVFEVSEETFRIQMVIRRDNLKEEYHQRVHAQEERNKQASLEARRKQYEQLKKEFDNT